MEAAVLVRAANMMQRPYGVLAVSVECAFDATVADACRSPRLALHGQVRLSTVGWVRAGALAHLPTPKNDFLDATVNWRVTLGVVRLFDPERCERSGGRDV